MTSSAPAPGVPTAPAPQTDPSPAPAPQPAPPVPVPTAPSAPATAADVASLPDWAQKLITDTRAEAADWRTKLRAAETSAGQQGELLGKVAAALGLDAGGRPDPAKLAEQLTASQAETKRRAVELAVYRGAAEQAGNPDALLDSRRFMAEVADLDPAAADFPAKVTAAIKAAVAANPTLKAAVQAPAAPPRSGGEFTGGPGGECQLTEDDLKSMTPEQIVEAQNKGLLKTLLGG
jgi:hypothetical protein